MKIRKSIPKAVALLLSLLLLLSSCAAGIEDPIGDLDNTENFAPYLSVEEADALFGAAVLREAPQFDGPYMYFIAKYPEGGKNPLNPNRNDPLTVYRYNCETGVVDYACRDTVCTHNYGSGCPFENVRENGPIVVVGDRLVYLGMGERGEDLKYYCPETREFATIAEDVANYWLVGDFVYYNHYGMGEDPDNPAQMTISTEEIWRWDPESGETVRIYVGDMNGHREPLLLHGKLMLLDESLLDPAGNLTDRGRWLYLIDPETGERELAFEKPLPSLFPLSVAGEWFLYNDFDITYQDDTKTLHLGNFVTGEDREIGTYEEGIGTASALLTENRILWLQPDPTDDYTKILYSFDILTGERSEYPLQCAWEGGATFYHRGRLYLREAYETDERIAAAALQGGDPQKYMEAISKLHQSDLRLEWDIRTGRQRVIDKLEVFEPAKSAAE